MKDFVEGTDDDDAKCGSCGVPWIQHIGIMGLCQEFVKLRKERDEARRELCNALVHQQHDPKEYAKGRGWDCYDEEADHNNESFKKGRMK